MPRIILNFIPRDNLQVVLLYTKGPVYKVYSKAHLLSTKQAIGDEVQIFVCYQASFSKGSLSLVLFGYLALIGPQAGLTCCLGGMSSSWLSHELLMPPVDFASDPKVASP